MSFLDQADDPVSAPGDFNLHSGLSTGSVEAGADALQSKDCLK